MFLEGCIGYQNSFALFYWKTPSISYCSTFHWQVCHPISSSQMICPTPQLPKNAIRSSRSTRGRRSSHLEVELGFIMDNVDTLRNLSGTGVNSKMQYYPDPVVYNFSEDNSIKMFKGEVLIFEVSVTVT